MEGLGGYQPSTREAIMVESSLLSGFALVAGLPAEALDEMARKAAVKSFSPGEVLFEEGAQATELYGLLEGEVHLSLVFRDRVLKADVRHEEYVRKRVEIVEKEMVFETIEPGDVFAWSALIPPHRMTSTARCSAATRVVALPADALEDIFGRHPQAGAFFMKRLAEVIARRLRSRTDKLIESWYEAFGEDHL
jgi:CRP-like cAMP-binding protein